MGARLSPKGRTPLNTHPLMEGATMYYLILKTENPELNKLFPHGVPVFDSAPDEFIEIYDENGCDFLDIQPAFRINIAGLTPEQELRLLNQYATEMADCNFIVGNFHLLEKGWLLIPEDQVESVVWREGKSAFRFEYERALVDVR